MEQKAEFQELINCYTCSAGHKTVTIDRDEGTTPMFLNCQEQDCGKQAISSMYMDCDGLVPEHEWYKPNILDVSPMDMEHVLMGGLLIRKIGEQSEIEKTGNGNKTKATAAQINEISKGLLAFKMKNPKATPREIKRFLTRKYNIGDLIM